MKELIEEEMKFLNEIINESRSGLLDNNALRLKCAKRLKALQKAKEEQLGKTEQLHKLLQHLIDEDELIRNRTNQQIVDDFLNSKQLKEVNMEPNKEEEKPLFGEEVKMDAEAKELIDKAFYKNLKPTSPFFKDQQPNKSAKEFLKEYAKGKVIESFILDGNGYCWNNLNHIAKAMEEYSKQSNWISVEQCKIVKQRLDYHFKNKDGSWIIPKGMPFMKEFLKEVEKLTQPLPQPPKQ